MVTAVFSAETETPAQPYFMASMPLGKLAMLPCPRLLALVCLVPAMVARALPTIMSQELNAATRVGGVSHVEATCPFTLGGRLSWNMKANGLPNRYRYIAAMARHTVAQLAEQLRELREQCEGPDREEILSMWKLLGAMVSMLETIVLASPTLANHEHVNYVLHELVEMHKEMVSGAPGLDDAGDTDTEPSTKRRRLDSAENAEVIPAGSSTGSRPGRNTSPDHLDDDVLLNDDDAASPSDGSPTGQPMTRESHPWAFPPPGFNSDNDRDKLL